ncbi:MAG: hypothetical protein ABIG39_04475 [Candidatus Micrarchaeota archaeon]
MAKKELKLTVKNTCKNPSCKKPVPQMRTELLTVEELGATLDGCCSIECRWFLVPQKR